ncbi:hypothetical protein FXF36_03130 [Pseudobutyrivibrio xylanivorans]|uniref:Uncharacterized protein n=1 Tax=Pseudobutyrivibrio xylanivorans TaxID=185007 RepID=A0A5P6VQG1_PSEXY|nr:hypothetical protein FXF36_03130 [Pseudobutyrivibrio xylanivorans]
MSKSFINCDHIGTCPHYEMQYEQVLKTYPIIAELYASVKELYEIIYSKHSDRLDALLSRLEDYNIPE